MKHRHEENSEESLEEESLEEKIEKMHEKLVEKMEAFTLEEQREIAERTEPIIEEIKARYRDENANSARKRVYSMRCERYFSAKELAEEIFPLLEDCFEAEIDCDGATIYFDFLNGQKFRLTIKAINA